MIDITVPQIILTVFLSLLGFILLLLTLIIAIRVKVTLKIRDELTLFITAFGIRFQIFPKKKKKYKLKNYTLKKIRAREEKQAKKDALKAQKKAEKAAAKKAKGKGRKLTKEEKAQKRAERPKTSDIASLFIELLKLAPRTFLARFHFHVAKLHITVGGENAATAAITCGAISGALYPLLEFLDRHSNLHRKNADIYVGVDYTQKKIKFNGDIAFSMSIFGLLCVALKLAFKFIVGWSKIKPDTPNQ